MKRDNYYKYIEKQLHVLANRITTNGKLNMLHLHLHSENFYLHFYNLLYGTNLKNLNDTSQNVEAIDLIDYDKKIMIQVSSTSTKQKIESSLKKDILKEYTNYRFKFISIAKDATDLRHKTYENPHSITFDPKEDIYDIRSFLNSISSLDIDKQKSIYEFIQKELGEESKKRFDSTIFKTKYLNDFKTISLLINIQKSIDDIFINLAIIKEREAQKEKEILEKEIYDNNWEAIHKPKEPIAIEELINTSKKSLIYGKAGIGKTTLCKYIAYKWAKGEIYQEFEYVIYLPLRNWKLGNERLKEEIRREYRSQYKNEINLDIENNSKILFLFDGYDELKHDAKERFRKAINDSYLIHYIITTRPYGYQKNDFIVNEHFETIGFTDENVDKYIGTFFKENHNKAKSLKAFLQINISIKHIGYIPLMLEMICSQWDEKGFSKTLTMTKLYRKVIEDLLSVYARKKNYETVYKKKYKSEIEIYLGSIAFRALKKQTIVISGKVLDKSLKKINTDDEDDFLEQSIFYAGFLKSDNNSEDPWKNNYQFPHLTFQEYFSALHVSKQKKKNIRELIQKYKFHPHMQMFFSFLGGLINEEWFLDELESKPIDIIDVYIPNLVFICISEIDKNKLHNKKERLLNDYIKLLSTVDSSDFEKKNKIINSVLLIEHFIDIKFIDKLIDEIPSNIFSSVLITLGKRNKDVAYKILEIVENNQIKNDSLSSYLISSLTSLGINTDDFIDRLLQLSSRKYDYYTGENSYLLIAKSLNRLNRRDDGFVDKLIMFVIKENINNHVKFSLIQSLWSIGRIDDIFQKKIIQILLSNNIEFYSCSNYEEDYRGFLARRLALLKNMKYENILIHIASEPFILKINRLEILITLISNGNMVLVDIFLEELKRRYFEVNLMIIREPKLLVKS